MILLRDLEEQELAQVAVWLEDDQTRRALPYLREDVGRVFGDESLHNPKDRLGDKYREIALIHDVHKFIGYARVSRRVSARGPWGSFEMMLAPAFQGQGLGRVVLPLVAVAAQEWAASKVIQIAAFEDNLRALYLYQTVLGYKVHEHQWWSIGDERRRVSLLSNDPAFFAKGRAGF